MKDFLNEDFLLKSESASKLYHLYAKMMPIIDYHNHLSPKDIAEDRKFSNITQAWLEGDHYKWRAMRANGISEEFITGNASDKDKFLKWAETVPNTARNPLYHWTHLELRRYFGITDLLSAKTADKIYEETNTKLADADFSARGLLKKMDVKVVCTTDSPEDDLKYHKMLGADDSTELKLLPTFRPDNLYAIDDAKSYLEYLDHLGEIVSFSLETFDDLINASQKRVDYFDSVGGRLADHGFEQLYPVDFSHQGAKNTFKKLRQGESLEVSEIQNFKMVVLLELCKMYHAKGWVQQFHLGPLRSNNSRMLQIAGRDSGFDSMTDTPQVKGLGAFFNELDKTDQLAKSILYNLNPAFNEAFVTMAGNFNDGSVAGKIQHGSGWWFLDQKDGMERQMNALSNMGLLSQFVGMLTDSRSFLSFTRHEYFRRVLCNLIGEDIENGELPNDLEWLGGMVQDICYNNAVKYFKF